MKAMILAAGLGTRLRPLTNDCPKALITISGHTLLEIALARLRSVGVRDAIVNVHHFADMVIDYLHANSNFGMRIAVSREQDLLDTGGGLKHAAWFFLQEAAQSNEPFLLHNVDVISTIDLASMARFHMDRGALATLAVQHRDSSRLLLFDHQGNLCGRRTGRDGNSERTQPTEEAQAFAFSGIHVLSPRIFSKLDQHGAFSIIDAYLCLAAQGETIAAFPADGVYWRDLGRPDSLAAACLDLDSGKFVLQRDCSFQSPKPL